MRAKAAISRGPSVSYLLGLALGSMRPDLRLSGRLRNYAVDNHAGATVIQEDFRIHDLARNWEQPEITRVIEFLVNVNLELDAATSIKSGLGVALLHLTF